MLQVYEDDEKKMEAWKSNFSSRQDAPYRDQR